MLTCIFTVIVLFHSIHSEVLNRTTADYQTPGSCTSYPCIFNCDEQDSCRDTTISCGVANGGGVCTLNLKGTYAAYQSTINTGTATEIYINVAGTQAMYQAKLFANTVIGAKLYITVTGGGSAFAYVELHTPYGMGSLLRIICGTDATSYDCRGGIFYDDYTTTIELYSYSVRGFQDGSCSPQPGILHSSNPLDPLYENYRAPVTLWASTGERGYQSFTYTGTDHGNWTLESSGHWGFYAANIWMDHSFITNDEYYIDISAYTNNYAFGYTNNFYMTQNNAHVNINMQAPYAATYHEDTYYTNFHCTRNDTVWSSLTITAANYWSLRFSKWNIDCNISGDVIVTADGNGGMRDGNFRINRIDGSLTMSDSGATGIGFYQLPIEITHGVGGDVLLLDESIASGQVFRYNTFTVGSIGGSLSVIEDSEYGLSFTNKIWTIGHIGGDVLFRSFSDNNRQSMQSSTYNIQSVAGKMDVYSNSYRSFYACTWNIPNGIDGSLTMYDTGSSGEGFRANTWNINNGINGDLTMVDLAGNGLAFYDSNFYFYGNITGSVSIRDQSTRTSPPSQSFYSNIWEFNTIYGDMEFIEKSITGNSFAYNSFTIDYIGGSLLFSAENANTYQAFDISTWNIGIVNKNLTFYSNNYGAFSEGIVNIKQVNNIAMFKGISATGFDFYHTDFNITNAPEIVFDVLYSEAIRLSNNIFGNGVQKLTLIIRGGVNTLYQSNWDCRNCNEFELQCLNDADCGGVSGTEVNIWCPENNGNNKCIVGCDQLAQCDWIDLFTTSGYCYDAKFECSENINNDCIIDNSKIYCTTNTNNNYGDVTTTYCTMKQDIINNNLWFCDDFGPSDCSALSCTNAPTIHPSITPTQTPSQLPTTTQPTLYPTIQPTIAPTTSIPTTTQPTNSPNNDPSSAPTTSVPTINPTIYPSIQPTIYPTTIQPTTNEPSLVPTFNPSLPPTNNPIIYTNIPTINPTYTPTKSPKNRPTIIPTNTPTKSPFNSGGAGDTTEVTQENDSNKGELTTQHSSLTNSLVYIIIGLVVLVFCIVCILIIVFYIMYKNNKKQKKEYDSVRELVRIGSLSNVTGTNIQSLDGDGLDGLDGLDGDGDTTTHEIAVIPGSDNNNKNEKKKPSDPQIISAPIVFGDQNALNMWLKTLNLTEYENIFIENGFDGQLGSLSELTDEHLKEMGIKKIGHRLAIMKQVKLMKITVDADKNNDNIEGPNRTGNNQFNNNNNDDNTNNNDDNIDNNDDMYSPLNVTGVEKDLPIAQDQSGSESEQMY